MAAYQETLEARAKKPSGPPEVKEMVTEYARSSANLCSALDNKIAAPAFANYTAGVPWLREAALN
jgi:hypothetical protein